MATAELHGRSITPFEQGFLAFIKGVGHKENPFDGEKSPVSNNRWAAGWNKAQREAGRKA
ncbi:hypothetical protein [Pseudomonas veronii]